MTARLAEYLTVECGPDRLSDDCARDRLTDVAYTLQTGRRTFEHRNGARVHNAPLYAMQASLPTVVNQAVDPGGVEANLLLWTGDFTNAAWGKTALTVTAARTCV